MPAQSSPDPTAEGAVSYPAGQRLRCHNCGAVVTVVTPCTCNPPDLTVHCCAQTMRPETEADEVPAPPRRETEPDQVGVAPDLADDERSPFVAGQRLLCPDCGSEVEVTIVTPARQADQSFSCCGKDMTPTAPAER